jgi:Ran GTPase-activating protein (RanGAP) involved in mRNA processing and transport
MIKSSASGYYSGLQISELEMNFVLQHLKDSIETLDLSNNFLSKTMIEKLTIWIQQNELKGLKHLNLSRSSLGPGECLSLLEILNKKLLCLETLDLSYNRLSNLEIDIIISFIRNSTCLKKLNLSKCGIGSIEMAKIFEAIGTNTSIEVAIFKENIIGESEILSEVIKCPSLCTLDLQLCDIHSPEQAAKILDLIKKQKQSSNLKSINIAGNSAFTTIQVLMLKDLDKTPFEPQHNVVVDQSSYLNID